MAHAAALGAYDEEFNRGLMMARNLIGQLPRKHDRDIASKWVAKLCDMKTRDVAVKRHRNQFFKYLLTVLHRSLYDVPTHFGYPQYTEQHGCLGEKEAGKDYMSRWSPDKKTYVAVKVLPGKGALVYMASTKQPELGWDIHN